MKKWTFILVVLAMDCGVQSAIAAQTKQEGFAEADLDQNGQLSQQEYETIIQRRYALKGQTGALEGAAKMFPRKDANDDGFLSLEEFVQKLEVPRLDANADGVVTTDEYAAQLERRLAKGNTSIDRSMITSRVLRKDPEGDGFVSTEAGGGRPAQTPGSPNANPGSVRKMDLAEYSAVILKRGAKGGEPVDAATTAQKFRRRDIDGDGFLNAVEFTAEREAKGKEGLFEKFDADGIPGLSVEEYKRLVKMRYEVAGKGRYADDIIFKFSRRDIDRDGILSKAEFMDEASSERGGDQ